MYLDPDVLSPDPAWTHQPIRLMRMNVDLEKPDTLTKFGGRILLFFQQGEIIHFPKRRKPIWVKSCKWFYWQSLMSEAEKIWAQIHFYWVLTVGLSLHLNTLGPPSWGSGFHLSFLSSSLFPSASTLAIRHVLLAMHYFSWRKSPSWEKDCHCLEAL